jgi:hypothetical protein
MEHFGTALPLPRVYLDAIVDTEQDEEESLQMKHATATAIDPLQLSLRLLMHCDNRQLEPHRLQLLFSFLLSIVSLKDIAIIIPSRRSVVVAARVHPSISCSVGCVTCMSVGRYEDAAAAAASVGIRLANRISTCNCVAVTDCRISRICCVEDSYLDVHAAVVG